jgi:hypothetical protein
MRPDNEFLKDPRALVQHLSQVLNRNGLKDPFLPAEPADVRTASAVMVMLGRSPAGAVNPGEPCLILNKRSENVRQPGDLCCPGGSLMPRLDTLLSHVIQLPLLPLGRWKPWPEWKRQRPKEARTLALLLATSLRESVEEMRLNPFGIRFLGPLPPYRLLLFKREIYPLVGWVSGCQRFRTNWEVEKIVHLPLRDLLDGSNFYRYRLQMGGLSPERAGADMRELPSFRHPDGTDNETLWGATYHIAMRLLRLAFDFEPPGLAGLPVINGRLGSNYLTGNNAPGD